MFWKKRISKKDKIQENLCDQKLKGKSVGFPQTFWNRFFHKKKMDISWYVKLNIMIMSFLFVLFFIKQLNTPTFKASLNRMFFITDSQDRLIRLKITPSKPKKKADLR